MRIRLPVLLSLVLLLAGLGCAGLSNLLPCPEGFEAAAQARGIDDSCGVLRNPRRLYERSEATHAQGDDARAYDYLALLHTLHPGSKEDDEAWVPATRLFGRLNFAYRPQYNRWDTTELQFMFGWLETYFERSDEFPHKQVDELMRGLRWPVFQDFIAYTKGRPAFERWKISGEKDNGYIVSITAVRTDAPAAAGSSNGG